MGILNDVKGIKIAECGEQLELLSGSSFVLEPMYFKWGYSNIEEIKLRSGVVEKLKKVAILLPKGWKIKIWDGFRTLAVQKILYDNYWNELVLKNSSWNDDQLREAVEVFVSPPSHDPALPAPHNTGGAIDLTLINADGEDLDMGTGFDEFDVKSYTNHFAESEDEYGFLFHSNRMLLLDVMVRAGFVNYHEEWWHFSYGDQDWARQHGLGEAIYGSMEFPFLQRRKSI